MKTHWQIKDIIDLEYFFHRDKSREKQEQHPALRDREIYLQHIRPLLKNAQTEEQNSRKHRNILRLWLEQRRNMEKAESGQDAVLPGSLYTEIYRLLCIGMILTGLLCGAGTASALLHYTGAAPLNVSLYLGCFVFFQIFLLLLLLGFTLFRVFRPSLIHRSLLFVLLSRFFIRLMMKIAGKTRKKMSASHRYELEAAVGLLRGRKKVYGLLFYWPVFIPIQLFALFFNAAVLGTTLLKVLGSDIAFGWQSTIQFSAQTVFDAVRFLSLPWSAFVPPEIAHPSLAQIQGSRMILKEGIWHLATPDLVSWWPFLCFCVFFYALLPRLLLFLTALALRQTGLGKLDFRFAECEALMQRMCSPLLHTGGRPTSSRHCGTEQQDAPAPENPETLPDENHGSHFLMIMIPDDIYDQCGDSELRDNIAFPAERNMTEKLRIGDSAEKDIARAQQVLRKQDSPAAGQTEILILQEAWQPPIREILTFIARLRENIGDEISIRIGLIGKPRPGTVFTAVKEEDWNIWEQKLRSLGDPRLRAEKLVSE
jgi:hypothetical protein